MSSTWILVASAAQARLFKQESGRGLALVETFSGPPPRLHSRPLPFAQDLAQHLEQGAQQSRYSALAVFAANPFMGELRRALGPSTRRRLAGAHDVDLSGVGVADMEKCIRDVVEHAH